MGYHILEQSFAVPCGTGDPDSLCICRSVHLSTPNAVESYTAALFYSYHQCNDNLVVEVPWNAGGLKSHVT